MALGNQNNFRSNDVLEILETQKQFPPALSKIHT